jgi:Fic family protein
MPYEPRFTIRPRLLTLAAEVAVLRERIEKAAIELSWIPTLRKDSLSRNAHASTAIEGNPLTLEQVRALEEERTIVGADDRSRREALNYFAALRHIEKHASKKVLRHEDIFKLHRILAAQVMDQGQAGRYRSIPVRVGSYFPPVPQDVSGLMFELLEWWNKSTLELSPILSSAIIHYRFEAIHPFADGNGRTGRALALWELYRRGFDTHHIFSVDEYYWEDRARYYRELAAVRHEGENLTAWLEYCAEGLRQTLAKVWLRIQILSPKPGQKLALRPKQERLLQLLCDHGRMSPAEIWAALKVSKQGAMDLLKPLLQTGLVEKIGGRKTGRYALRKR